MRSFAFITPLLISNSLYNICSWKTQKHYVKQFKKLVLVVNSIVKSTGQSHCWHLFLSIYMDDLQQITRSSDFSFTSLFSGEEYIFIRIIGARVFAAIDGKVYCRWLISETSATPDINIAVVGDLLLSELLAYLIVSRSHARGTPSHHAVHHEPFCTILDLYSFTWRKLLTDLTLSNVFHIFVSSYERRRNEILSKGDHFPRQSFYFIYRRRTLRNLGLNKNHELPNDNKTCHSVVETEMRIRIFTKLINTSLYSSKTILLRSNNFIFMCTYEYVK